MDVSDYELDQEVLELQAARDERMKIDETRKQSNKMLQKMFSSYNNEIQKFRREGVESFFSIEQVKADSSRTHYRALFKFPVTATCYYAFAAYAFRCQGTYNNESTGDGFYFKSRQSLRNFFQIANLMPLPMLEEHLCCLGMPPRLQKSLQEKCRI